MTFTPHSRVARTPTNSANAPAGRLTPRVHFVRAVCVDLMKTASPLGGSTTDQLASEFWPQDEILAILIKGAVPPATTTTSGWASQLATQAVSDFILNLGPVSAGSQLLKRGLSLSFDGSGSILVPTITAATSSAAFVPEGFPIPVEQLATSGPTLSPKKLATIATFTRELFQHSVPNIEMLVRAVLSESVAASIDLVLFDSNGGDATRPAGLRNGISVTTASAATPDSEAMYEDLSTLLGIVAPVAGSSPIIFVASPKQAAAIKMRQPNFAYELLSSSALAAGTVIAIASNCLVSAIDPSPRIESSIETTLHYEDTSPLSIVGGTSGTPLPSFQSRSLFQTDQVGLRLILEVAWGLRAAGGLAWTQSTLW
jgi:hypothetical protein